MSAIAECHYDERKRATKEEAELAIANAREVVHESQKILRRIEKGEMYP